LEDSGIDDSTLIQCILRLSLFWDVTWRRMEARYRRFGEIIGSVISRLRHEVRESLLMMASQ